MNRRDDSDPTYANTYRLLPELANLRYVIQQLPLRHRLAFGLCCCERLYPSYVCHITVIGVADSLRGVIDSIWSFVVGDAQSLSATDLMQQCESLPLGIEGSSAHFHDSVTAVGSVHMVLQAYTRYSIDFTVRVASAARDRIAAPLRNYLAQQFGSGIGDEEQEYITLAVRNDPTMKAEIERQTMQLRLLLECERLTRTTIRDLLAIP